MTPWSWLPPTSLNCGRKTMDLYAVRRISSGRAVGLFFARGFASIEPDGLRGMVAAHCDPALCEATMVNQGLSFVGAGYAAGRFNFKVLKGWQALVPDGINRPYLIRLMQSGKAYYYFRVGETRTRLPGKPGDKDFEAAYLALFNAETKRRGARQNFELQGI